MTTELSLVAAAVLLVLIAVSVKKQWDARMAEKDAEARSHTGTAEAQHERSLRRRADARASYTGRPGG